MKSLRTSIDQSFGRFIFFHVPKVKEALVLAALFAVFYFVLPYTYADSHYHHENTPRLSSSFLSAALLSFIFSVFTRVLPGKKYLVGWGSYILLGLVLFGLGTISPILLGYGLIIVVMGLMALVIASRALPSLKSLILMVFAIGLLFLEPFYVKDALKYIPGFAVNKKAIPVKTVTSLSAKKKVKLQLRPFLNNVLTNFVKAIEHPIASMQRNLTYYEGVSAAAAFWLFWLGFALFSFLIISFSRQNLPFLYGVVTLILMLLFCSFLIPPITAVFSQEKLGLGLLHNYLLFHREQLVYILVIVFFLGVFTIFMERLPMFVFILTCFISVYSLNQMMGIEKRVTKTFYRKNKNIGLVRSQEMKTIRFIERHFSSYKRGGGILSFKKTPKILVPNWTWFRGGNTFIFPIAEARVLPYFETYPLAFYYDQGSLGYRRALYFR